MKRNNWIVKAFLLTFFIALIFNFVSNTIVNKFNNIIILSLLCLLFVIIGIVFDIIGTAVLSSKEAVFHAKSSKKIRGSKEGVYLVKNSSTIASICNDVIGDICGIVSGTVSAMLGMLLASKYSLSVVLVTLLVSSFVSSITVGGKAIGKKYAIKNADEIIFFVAKVLNRLRK